MLEKNLSKIAIDGTLNGCDNWNKHVIYLKTSNHSRANTHTHNLHFERAQTDKYLKNINTFQIWYINYRLCSFGVGDFHQTYLYTVVHMYKYFHSIVKCLKIEKWREGQNWNIYAQCSQCVHVRECMFECQLVFTLFLISR